MKQCEGERNEKAEGQLHEFSPLGDTSFGVPGPEAKIFRKRIARQSSLPRTRKNQMQRI